MSTKTSNCKKALIVFNLLVLSNYFFSQQEIKFKYILNEDFLKGGVLSEKVVVEGKKSKTLNGWYLNGKDTIKIFSFSDSIRWEKRTLIPGNELLTTLKVTADTFNLQLWYAKPEYKFLADSVGKPLSLNNDADYRFIMDSTGWDLTRQGYPYASIQYRLRQVTATNMPFMYNFNSKKFTTNLLNANMTYLFLYGHSRYFESKFVAPRNWYYGWGPFAGFNVYEIAESDSRNMGFNVGINGTLSFYNFNFLIALGAQRKFDTSQAKTELYIGFGVGFKLLDVFTPNGKD